jgi:hypothetical protein
LSSAVSDGLTPACSSAAALLPSVVAAGATYSSGGPCGTCSSSSSGGGGSATRRCPQIVFLSQNDPGDNVAAVLRAVGGVACVDLSGLRMSTKVGAEVGGAGGGGYRSMACMFCVERHKCAAHTPSLLRVTIAHPCESLLLIPASTLVCPAAPSCLATQMCVASVASVDTQLSILVQRDLWD